MKKKYLAYFITDLETLNGKITTQKFLIDKLCKNFEKIFIINTQNLKFFKTKEIYNKNDFFLDKKNSKLLIKNKNLKLPNNVHFFNPSGIKDFERFMTDKDLVVINSIGRHLNELRVHFLIKKYNFKQIQISNIGNLQNEVLPIKKYDLKAILNKFKHSFGRLITVVLSNLGLVPKIDVRFVSDKQIIKRIKHNTNFFFKKFNLGYYKKHILINSKAYDYLVSNKSKISEKKIVLLDMYFKHPEYLEMGSAPKPKTLKEFYIKLNKLLKILSKNYKKKVVICLHPKDNLKEKKKIFNKYEVVKYKSQKNILNSFMVLFFDTAAIVDAILLKKNIIYLKSSLMDKNAMRTGDNYHKKAGVFKLNLDEYEFKNKKTLLNQLNKSKINQLNYIKSYLTPDGDNLGFEKIISFLKKNFFR